MVCNCVAYEPGIAAYKPIERLKLLKLDVDENGQTPARYDLRAISALLIFKDGKVVEQIVGFVPKATIDQTVIKVLA